MTKVLATQKSLILDLFVENFGLNNFDSEVEKEIQVFDELLVSNLLLYRDYFSLPSSVQINEIPVLLRGMPSMTTRTDLTQITAPDIRMCTSCKAQLIFQI